MSAKKVTVYMSKEAEEAVVASRKNLLDNLPFKTTEIRVPTYAGETVVTVCGPEDAPPFILWQGANGPAPLLLRGLPDLVKQYRIYSPDNPGHGGSLSDPMKPDPADHGLGLWAKQVLDGLAPYLAGKAKPVHMGTSFGGAILMDLASIAPERIKAAVLWVPISLNPSANTGWGLTRITVSIVLPWLLYRSWPNRFTQGILMGALADRDVDPVLADTSCLIIRSIKPDQEALAPPIFTAKDLAGFEAPMLVISGAGDVFAPGEGTAVYARQVFSNVQTEVFPGKHMFGKANMAAALQKVVQFLQASANSS
jgi:pimeloyl-ACP methyl ester carboxylesterase